MQDHDEIVAVAMNGEFKDAAVTAVDRLTDRADLELIASRANNKNAMKRARTILRELDERIAAEAAPEELPAPRSGRPRTGIEREQIVQRLVGLSPVDDMQALEAALTGRGRSLDVAGSCCRFRARDAVRGRVVECARTDRGRAAREAERARVEAETGTPTRRTPGRGPRRRRSGRRRARAQRSRTPQRRLLELVAEVEAAAADEDLRSSRRRFGLAQREWKDMTVHVAADGDLTARFTAAETRLTVRDVESKETDRRARRDALNRLHQLLARVEPLASRDDLSVKATERALSDVRAALVAMPPLPSKQDYDDGVRRLKAVQAALTPKLQELREIEGWQRWANVGIQEQLCEKMEALKAAEDPEEIARRIRELQQQWRQAADVPRAQGEALWRRFKAAHDEVWTRCEAHFAAEAERRQENLAKKIALCERAEALAGSTNWMQTAEEIKRLQADWKTIGPVSRGQEKPVWERFRVACDRFFTRRHEDLAQRKAVWAENLAKKDALCARAEALAESTDWDAAAAELRRLQGEWKAIGPVKKSRSEAIWQRFRGACDRFFMRFAQRHEIAREERVAAREAICAELAAFAAPEHDAASASQGPAAPEPDTASATATAPDAGGDGAVAAGQEPPPDLLATVRSLRARWQQELALRGVDPDRAAALDRRFAAAFGRVIARWPQVFAGTDLDPDANRRRMEALVLRVEAVAASLGGPAVGGRRQRADPGDASGRHAQGSAGGEHDWRQGRRREPLARGAGRRAPGAGKLVAHWSRAGTGPPCARRSVPAGMPAGARTARRTSRVRRRPGRAGAQSRVVPWPGRPGWAWWGPAGR